MNVITAPHYSTATVIDAGSRWLRSPTLTDPVDTATSGRFKRENREVVEQMRQADCQAWSTIEHRLGDRERQLREGRNE
jgi:hypothetical protein